MTSALALFLALAQGARPAKPAQPAAEFPHRSEEMEFVGTETGFTLPAMTVEGDVTLSWVTFDNYRKRSFDLEVMSLTLEAAYGITDWVQAELEIPFLWVDPDPGRSENGLSDIVLEGKASLRKGSSPIGFVPVDLSAGARIILPTGDEDEGLGREKAALGLFGAASYPFLPWLAGHAEVWTEWQRGFRPLHGLDVAAEFTPWMKELSLLGAFNVQQEGGDSPAISLVPGAEYRFSTPRPRMSVGLGLPIGLTSRAPDYGFQANFQIRF